jgi:hypothetical protein
VIKANRFQAIANFKGAIGNWDRVPCSESAFLAKLHAKSVLSLFVAPRVGGATQQRRPHRSRKKSSEPSHK